MARILVLYGTTEGHTARIAQSIAATLRAHGSVVDVIQAGRFEPQPDDYSGIVIAASVHGGRYQTAVRRWVRTHAHTFGSKPTAFVSVCLGVLEKTPEVQQQLDAIIARFLKATAWRPSTTTIVAGALLYTRYGWLKRWIMKRIVAKAGGDTDTSRDYEYTDWNEVRAFAADFAERVRASVRQWRRARARSGGRGRCRMTIQSIIRCSRHTVSSMFVLAAMGVSSPAFAQHTGAAPDADWQHGTTLVGFAGAQSASSNVNAAAGAGFGWEVTRQFSLEGRATWFNANGALSDFAATIGAHVPLTTARPVVPFVSAGVGLYRASFDSTSNEVPAFYRNRMPAGVPVQGSRAFQDFLVTMGGGVNVFLSKHVALRPEANVLLVTDWSDTRRVGVFGVQLVYHIDPHPIE